MTHRHLKPAERNGKQLRCRKPDGTLLAPEGELVNTEGLRDRKYWERRLASQDVVEVAEAKTEAPKRKTDQKES